MHRARLVAVALGCAALSSACYRVTVVTAAAPSATVVDKPFVNTFVIGLVPPSEPISVAPQCGGNVAKVVTERSFINGLVAAITSNIYTPLHVAVTCGTGGRRSSMGLPQSLLGTPASADTAASH